MAISPVGGSAYPEGYWGGPNSTNRAVATATTAGAQATPLLAAGATATLPAATPSAAARGSPSPTIDDLAAMLAEVELRQQTAEQNGTAERSVTAAGLSVAVASPQRTTTASAMLLEAWMTVNLEPADSNEDGVVTMNEELLYAMTHPTVNAVAA